MNYHRWEIPILSGLVFALLLSFPGKLLATDSQTPLAVLNGKNITESDLAAFDRGQITRMNNQIYLTRKQTLDAFLSEQLLTQEAQKRGLTREQLIQQEVVSKVQAPSDAEIEQWYNTNKSRLGNKTLAELKEQIAS